MHVFINQLRIFGPPNKSFKEICDEERLEIMEVALWYIHSENTWKPFEHAEDPEFSKSDREFICRIMKFDPRLRPTAEDLLKDEWFDRE